MTNQSSLTPLIPVFLAVHKQNFVEGSAAPILNLELEGILQGNFLFGKGRCHGTQQHKRQCDYLHG